MIVGSLCTGYGGLEMGLRMMFPLARLAWVADNDKAASILLAARYAAEPERSSDSAIDGSPDKRPSTGVPNLGDITKVDWSKVERVDLLAAGIPCQPHSLAGKGRGKDDERDLVEAFITAVRELRPKLIILENVPGFRRWGLPRVLGALAEMGFDARWHSVRASEAGACHQRERLFVLAVDPDSKPWLERWLSATGEEASGRPRADAGGSSGVGSSLSADPEYGSVAERSRGAWREGGERQAERGGPDSGGEAAPDANGEGPQGGRQEEDAPGAASPRFDWSIYEAAVRRQERVFGRLAPAPTEVGPKGNVRLAPRFPEWMMGVPDGWVTDFGFSRKDTFRLIGNGVVPRQAALAIWGLLNEESLDNLRGRYSTCA